MKEFCNLTVLDVEVSKLENSDHKTAGLSQAVSAIIVVTRLSGKQSTRHRQISEKW